MNVLQSLLLALGPALAPQEAPGPEVAAALAAGPAPVAAAAPQRGSRGSASRGSSSRGSSRGSASRGSSSRGSSAGRPSGGSSRGVQPSRGASRPAPRPTPSAGHSSRGTASRPAPPQAGRPAPRPTSRPSWNPPRSSRPAPSARPSTSGRGTRPAPTSRPTTTRPTPTDIYGGRTQPAPSRGSTGSGSADPRAIDLGRTSRPRVRFPAPYRPAPTVDSPRSGSTTRPTARPTSTRGTSIGSRAIDRYLGGRSVGRDAPRPGGTDGTGALPGSSLGGRTTAGARPETTPRPGGATRPRDYTRGPIGRLSPRPTRPPSTGGPTGVSGRPELGDRPGRGEPGAGRPQSGRPRDLADARPRTVEPSDHGRTVRRLGELRRVDPKRAGEIEAAGEVLNRARNASLRLGLGAVGGAYGPVDRPGRPGGVRPGVVGGGRGDYGHGGYGGYGSYNSFGFCYYGGKFSFGFGYGGYACYRSYGGASWWWPAYVSCWYPYWYRSYRPYYYASYYPVVYSSIVYRTTYVDEYDTGYATASYGTAPADGYVGEPTGEATASGSLPAPAAAEPEEPAAGLSIAAERYLTLGDGAFREGRFVDAVQFYAKATELAPGEAALHLVLADALFAAGDYHYAAYSIRRALELDPALAEAVVDKHDFYLDPAEFDRQLARLEQYVLDHPTDSDARLVLALNYLFGRRPAEAVKLIESGVGPSRKIEAAAERILAVARAHSYGPPAGETKDD